MSRRTLEQSHTYREVHAALSHNPNLMGSRNGGRHTIYLGPDGPVPVPNHNGDVPHGTLKSICRLAAAAGLVCLVLAVLLAVVVL
jgi:predicted RNA binding protein YcfA (HicA-like mRNA interferase family)